MKTETKSKELIYTHPVTGIMYRKSGDVFEYLVTREGCFINEPKRKVWIKSGMKRGFILRNSNQ